DGILVPGGFGKRGIEGMLVAIRYARENKVPYFGICLGMQTACVEFARNVCGLADANSSEFDPATPHRIIYKLRELRGVEELGGTMRLGAWACKLEPGSHAHKAYGALEISERHRHRYEFNREYEAVLTGAHCLPKTYQTCAQGRFFSHGYRRAAYCYLSLSFRKSSAWRCEGEQTRICIPSEAHLFSTA